MVSVYTVVDVSGRANAHHPGQSLRLYLLARDSEDTEPYPWVRDAVKKSLWNVQADTPDVIIMSASVLHGTYARLSQSVCLLVCSIDIVGKQEGATSTGCA